MRRGLLSHLRRAVPNHSQFTPTASRAISAMPKRVRSTQIDIPSTLPLWIGGQAVHPGERGTGRIVVQDKFTEEEVTTVAAGTPALLDEAFELAAKAVRPMGELASFQRKSILRCIVKRISDQKERLANVIAIEAGKPIKDARGEIARAISTFEIAAEESTRIQGKYTPLDINEKAVGYSSITRKFPIGVVSMITPFNFPWNLVAHKIAPAIAVGCPFVLKPASATPISALLLAQILADIPELPSGAFSVLPTTRESSDYFTTHEVPRLLSFTGSAPVGWSLKSKCGKKKVILELGGNAAVIIDEDTDIDDAVARIIFGGFYQSGQSCISIQRVFCHASLIEKFTKALVARARELRSGDPLDDETVIGPMISEKAAQRIEEWTQDAVRAGARVLCGGKRNGRFYDATILTDVPRDAQINREEAFAPVLTIQAFSTFQEAVDLVNDSKFGLQAGVFTRSLDRAFYAHERIEAGGIVLNDVPSVRIDSQPYGGVKDSGLGREGVAEAMEAMLETRVLVMRNVGDASHI